MRKNLEKIYPEIAAQWHPTKNGNLKLLDMFPSSRKKVWWMCPVKCAYGCLHEWEATICSRTENKTGCPICSHRNICEHSSIAFLYPDLAKQWHPTKNGSLKPSDVSPGSCKKIWWSCPKSCLSGCPHEWESTVAGRTSRNYGCPMCCNLKICEHMSLSNTHPELAAQWHPIKNGTLNPSQVIAGSHHKVWWLCPNTCPEGCIHEWEARIERRALRGDGCPNCSRKGKKKESYCPHMYLSYTHPEIAAQWHPTKNGRLLPSMIMSGSEEKVWWICPKICSHGCLHEWYACVKSRTVLDAGCSFCTMKQLCVHTSLLYTHPDIAAQWHPTKNGDLKSSDVSAGSHDKVWWLCPKKCPEGCPHEWSAVIKSRIGMNAGCAVCDRKKICKHISILYTHPDIAKEWHPTKNGNLKPSDVSFGAGEKVWWICPKNASHEYSQVIVNRTSQGQGCNICKNKTEGKLYDYLINIFPSLIKQLKIDTCKKKSYLPFDFAIPELKTIIELDGSQHFKQVSNWKSALVTRKEDIFKMQKATKEGYKVIRIYQEDVLASNDIWLEEHLLSEIRNADRNHVFIATVASLYDEHIQLYESHIEIVLNDVIEG